MSQLDRLRAKLQADVQAHLVHPLDEGVVLVCRPPDPDERDAAMGSTKTSSTDELIGRYATLIAVTLVEVRVDGQVAASDVMGLAEQLGIPWEQGVTTAAEVIRQAYGHAYNALIGAGQKVMTLTVGAGSDAPFDEPAS